MKMSLRTLGYTLPLLLVWGARQIAAAPAASPLAPLSADEIVTRMVERNLERARALAAYQGTRVYRLEYRGFLGDRTAEMIVDVKYRSPATKEFSVRSEKGSKIIIDRIFRRVLETEREALSEKNQSSVALNQENYRFTLAGNENTPAGSSYILSVEPRTDNKLLYRGRIWVDAADFAVARIEAAPAKNPSFWTKETKIEQVYAKVGGFWLPLSNRSSSEIRLGGRASLTIDYQDYEITAVSPPGRQDQVAGYR